MHNHLLSLDKTTFRWLLLLMTLLTAVGAAPAQAASYTFSGGLIATLLPLDNLPPGCSANLLQANTYTCGVLTLADGDMITITNKPITINFSGAFTTGTGTLINSGGSPADLILNLDGVLNMGINAKLIANVTGTAAVNLGANSEVAGSITATTTTGIITTGDNTKVGGAINAQMGAVTIGPNSTVNGTITASAGVVTIGANSQVYGDIQGGDGAINMGVNSAVHGTITAPVGVITIESNSHVYGNITGGLGAVTTSPGVTISGNITTNAGVVTIGVDNTVGDIITGDGGITIGDRSVVGTVSSPVGVITILNYVTVGGDVTSGAGAVNVESNSRICGNVIINGAGVLTLTTDVKVGGYITTTVGAITVGAGSTINGDAIISGAGVLTMTSAKVAGNISTVDGAITLTTSHTKGTVLASGAGVVTTTGSIINDPALDVPLACGVAPTPGTPISGSTATGLFDCLETGKEKPTLYTKLAGTAFTFDIAALKTDKTLESSYVPIGGTAKYVRVELFDDTTPPASCAAYANPVAIQAVAFTSSSGGRTLTGAFNLAGAYKKLRCRVTECTDSSCAESSATAEQSCSSDQFSVRPVAVALTSSANAVAPSSTSTPLIKAGANFNLSAVTASTDNYSGLLTLDASKLKAQNPSSDTIKTYDGVAGTLTSPLTANAAISNAAYSEVGYLYLAPGAYRDDEFTKVDSDNGDCISIASASSDNHLSAILVDGQYGCSIGNITEVSLGRFIPDHFGVTGSVVTRSELQTTEGQEIPFTYMDEPMQLNLTVTAYNKSEDATHNYQGKFAKLNTTDWHLSNWNCSGISDVQCMGLSATNDTTLLTDRLAIDTISPNSQVAGNTTISGGSIDGWSVGSSYFTVNILVKRYVNSDTTVNPNSKVTPVTPDGPFDVLILGVKPQDLDGVTLPPKAATDSAHCVDLNTKTGTEDSSCTFAEADDIDLRRKIVETKVRFGRLSISNAYGSELQNLPVPVEAQYWNGSSFVVNGDDNKTLLVDGNIIIGNFQDASTTPPTFAFGTADTNGSCSDSTLNGVMSKGKSCILFDKPSTSQSFDLLINLGSVGLAEPTCLSSTLLASGSSTPANMTYLSGNWCGTGYDRDPTAHITFGIYKDNSKGKSRLIYFREVY